MTMKIQTALIAGSIVLLCVAGGAYVVLSQRDSRESVASVASEEESFVFERADTEVARVQGLSGRKEVPSNYGLLFVFPTADMYGFWMKDMYVSIDIAWLSEEGVVLAIDENVSPDTFPQAFYPPRPVRYVLETRAGEMKRQGWGVGDRVPLP